MDPRDFISLAIRLSSSKREADLRSAVSRAYYGAFHVACALLEDFGIQLSRKDLYGADVHMKVRFCLRESGSQAVGRAVEKLGSLRGERNKADYDLKLRLFDPAGVAIQLRMTQEIVDAIDRCRNDPALAEIREKTRSYARDVLRFSLSDD